MLQANKARSSQIVFISILLILSLAFVIRIIALGSQSIWLDEAHSVWVAHMSPAGIWRAVADDVHPPLYFLALHYWMVLAGDSEFAVRLLSVIFGCLSVAAIYQIGKTLFDRETGLLCALFLAVTRMQVEFSQEARMYSLLVLLSLLSVLFFLRLFESGDKRTLFLYILCSILLMHTHFYALFVITAQNFFFLLLYFINIDIFRRTLRRWLLAQAALFVLFLPWLTALIDQIMRVRENFWIARFGVWILWQTLLEYSGTTTLAVIFLVLAIYALIAQIKNHEGDKQTAPGTLQREAVFTDRQKTIFLLIWFLTPMLLPFIYSQFSRPIYLPKYTLPGLVAFTILAARGITSIRPVYIRIFPPALIITLSLVSLPRYYVTPRKADWREAVHTVDASAQPGDLVLFNLGFSQLPFDYYSKRTDIIKRPFPDNNSQLTTANMREMLKQSVAGHDRVWLVLSLFDKSDLTEMIPNAFSDYEMRQYESTVGIELFLFQKRGTL